MHHAGVVAFWNLFKDLIQAHLRKMRGTDLAKMDMQAWDKWWSDLADVLVKLGCDPALIRARHDKLSVGMRQVLPHLNKFPQLPLSTGGLETLLSNRVKPLLAGRAHGFANVE